MAVEILENKNQVSHDSATTHVTGRSEYVDDRPSLKRELICGLVYSPYARAKIVKINLKAAEEIPGVVTVVTAKDVSNNRWGTIFQDQPLLAESEVFYAGEVVAVVAAENRTALAQGLKATSVEWEKQPAILSIDEAIQQKSFIGEARTIQRGEVEKALKKSPHQLKGVLTIQGADHFYLENQAALVYPKEGGQLEVHSSTQHPTETQHVVAKACGLDFKDVVCITKRLGGGFGGKESQAAPIAAFAALVSKKTQRPARLVLSKDDDMIVTGKRNPFQIFYEVGFSEKGEILALEAKLFSDGGAYADLSTAIMERAMLHCDNAYYIPHVKVTGQVCKTHFHPHTAFRGFGGPKGVALIESLMEDIARVVKKDSLEVRKMNCYREGKDTTHYGQKLENNLLPELFEKLEKDCDYQKRKSEINAWNLVAKAQKKNPRGISLTAVKFGISFTTKFLNQGNALVVIHSDGSLQVSTGAVEMGQGVNTRIAQIVSEEMGVELDHVRVMTTSTEKNANTSPTAASSGTDINGAAAQKACVALRKRLAALAIKLSELDGSLWASKTAALGTQPEIEIGELSEEELRRVYFEMGKVTVPERGFEISFKDLVREAYLNRISLTEYAHYRIPHLGFDKIKGQGRAFLYFTQGVAASEVEIDRFSGEVKVRRTDILMDLGRPINHDLDLGQVTGGFIQGMGWVTTENLVYSPEGLLLSHSPSTYKIPSIQDTPRVFNAQLIFNDDNTVNVKRTKAVGEPPLLLCLSVWTAIRDAIMSYRENEIVPMKIPATSERILRALTPEEFKSP